MATSNSNPPPGKPGFDAAVSAQEGDYLNRWPLAKEIYGIATGPREWSVRIGIYGEWGTGKTSVLNFVGLMGRVEDHIVIFFNPWQFGSTNDLWKSFVRVIFERLEETLGQRQTGSFTRFAKRFSGRIVDDAPKIIALWRSDAAGAAEKGLSYAKRFLTFGPNDLSQLQQSLGRRRIIVLIDDLDRTDPKLVPEMLFALKEIMDVPGMAFVCSFDPTVVGEVLGQFHPGFGDGLKFLDKIIDYPRWLPDPSLDQLARLAATDAERYCPYVPREALREAVSLLPANPRAIRQFVRLLALLGPQIERHLGHEIQWPILVAANVTKIRFPKLAPAILKNAGFWHSVYQASFDNKDGSEDKRKPIVEAEVQRIVETEALNKTEHEDLNRCLLAIAEKLELWFGLPYEGLMYQFHLAEEPCAVTWKEFEEFLSSVGGLGVSVEAVDTWIAIQSDKTGHSKDQIYRELVETTIAARKAAICKAADAITDAETESWMKRAETLLKVYSVLVLEMGHIDTENSRVTAKDVKSLLESIAPYFAWRATDVYRGARAAEEQLLVSLVSRWGQKILPLLNGLGIEPRERHDSAGGVEWKLLVQRLRALTKTKFATWLVTQFRESPSFVTTFYHGEEYRGNVRQVFLDQRGALWTERRNEMLALLGKAPVNELVRGNAYHLLAWFDYVIRKNEQETAQVRDLLSDKEIALAFWEAVLSVALNFRAIGSLRNVLQRLQESGFQPRVPEWWSRSLAEIA